MASANPPRVDPVEEESDESESEASDGNDQVVEDFLESESNIFKEPWKGSDVVLLVEERKFHVHKTVLSLNSPVFDAMFNTQFKEREEEELLLPEKKAAEVLDFLLQVYPQSEEDITMQNVGHILALADEYQTDKVIKSCEMFLRFQAPRTPQCIMETLVLAQMFRLANVREICCTLLKDRKINALKRLKGFDDLDAESLKKVVVPRLERLESYLEGLCPQVARLVNYAMLQASHSLRSEDKNELCPVHPRRCSLSKQPEEELKTRLKYCMTCKEMLRRLELVLANKCHNIASDRKLSAMMLEMLDLLET